MAKRLGAQSDEGGRAGIEPTIRVPQETVTAEPPDPNPKPDPNPGAAALGGPQTEQHHGHQHHQ